MSITNIVKRLQNIMRQDAGINGDAQRIEQIVWMLFLKVYDAREEFWEFYDDDYESIIPEECRWRNWAVDNKDGKALTGEDLLNFVNNELFPALKNIIIDERTERRCDIVKEVFEDTHNFMKDGILLRQVANVIDEVDFTDSEERHTFNDIYENILKDLQSAGNAGEYYTPRALTDFIATMLQPKITDKVADFACGTGGFLTSYLNYLSNNDLVRTPEEKDLVNKNIYGIEKKPLPHLLCMTNLLLHDIDEPNILHGNSLEKNVRDYSEEDKFDIIMMNPPYGGTETDSIKVNFPVEMQSTETADLFMALILYRLKHNGKVGVVLPDGFLFGTDAAKVAIKEKLLKDCNLHTIVRLPQGVFAPYTSITTNVLFFDKTGTTEKIHYYDIPLPEGYKSFSKTRPFGDTHMEGVKTWWNNRDNGDENAYVITKDEVVANGYNLDFKNPNKIVEEHNFTLEELLLSMTEKSKNISSLLEKISAELEGVEE